MASPTLATVSEDIRQALLRERNRQNAQHSTGPRTPEGKAISAQNSRKHGFSLSTHQVLQNEDPEAYNHMLADLQSIYQPQSPREHLAIQELAQCKWAIRRLDLAETELLNQHTHAASETLSLLSSPDHQTLDRLQRYRRPWQRRHQEALREFDRAVTARQKAEQLEIRNQLNQLKQELLQRRLHEQQQRKERELANRNQRQAFASARAQRERALAEPAAGFVSSPGEEPTPSGPPPTRHIPKPARR